MAKLAGKADPAHLVDSDKLRIQSGSSV